MCVGLLIEAVNGFGTGVAQRQGVVTYSAFTRGAGLLPPAVSVCSGAALRVSAVRLALTGFKSFNLHGTRGKVL